MRMRILPTANPLKDFADASCFLFVFLCQGQCDEDVIETNCMYFNWRPEGGMNSEKSIHTYIYIYTHTHTHIYVYIYI